MVIDIKMCRFDNVPWGFRLVGGSDFEYPLTVVKVTEGSIADQAGLKVGDVIVRINDTAASPLSHEESNRIINHCGNVFYFGVYREEAEQEEVPTKFPVNGVERRTTPETFLDTNIGPRKGPLCVVLSAEEQCQQEEPEYLPELAERPSSVLSENSEIKLVEEEIAAILSGESEVLKEHQVLGIFPKPGVCMTSDVLRTLNEEAIKTKAEKDKENKKWTTFLQKPNRPIPKSKQQLEAERRAANAYKVKIIKSAPRTPERSVSPAVELPKPQPQPEPEQTPAPEPEVEEPPPADSEIPNLEDDISANHTNTDEEEDKEKQSEDEKIDKEKVINAENSENAVADGDEDAKDKESNGDVNAQETKEPTPERVKTEEEIALERQLADVQKQLAALSSLPSTIQTTLDAVTKQLAELLPTFRLQPPPPPPPPQLKMDTETREISLEKIEESQDEAKEEVNVPKDGDAVESQREGENNADDENVGDIVRERDANDMEVESNDSLRKQDTIQQNEETRQMEEEQVLKKQKKHDVIDELEEHLERKNNPKQRSKRAFGPLTPSSERPLVLPGGRRWYKPKDAYNDEFIAETLSAQAELITGTTLGVNFMKYQKPEKKIDLNRSEVYKIIHHLDRQPVRGIEIRPPVVPAEADIRKAVHS